MSDKLIIRKTTIKVRVGDSNKFTEKVITMLLINPINNFYVQINEEPSIELLHKLRKIHCIKPISE